jgi:hypothetical protein
MSPLNIHPEEIAPVAKKKNNKNLKVFLGIGALIAIPVIGFTFAASIDINGGDDATLEFAQGVIDTAACDNDITISATSRWSAGAFVLDEITLDNFDFSTCNGKTLIISAVEGAGAEVGLTVDSADPADVKGDVAEILISYTNASTRNVSCVKNTQFTCPVVGKIDGDSFTFKVTDTPEAAIASVSAAKFLIQSS